MIDTNSLFSSLCLRSLTFQLLLLFSYPVMSDSLWPDGLQHTRPVCPSSPEVCPSSYLVASSHLIILCPLPLCPQSFPASRSFPMSQLFASDNQNTGVSASACPSSEYSGLISLKIDWFNLLAVQGTFRTLLQHHNLKATMWTFWFFLISICLCIYLFGCGKS